MNYEKLAYQRVRDNLRLKVFEDTIFYDWPNWSDHMEWIATADIEEIVDWAITIESDSESE